MNCDLVGYGGDWPVFIWCDGSRLAVSVVVNVEEGAKHQVIDGDATSERTGEGISVVPEGRPDLGQAQIFAYGRAAERAADEAADLERAAAATRSATSVAPQGFFCRGAESPWSRERLAERGNVYTSNGFARAGRFKAFEGVLAELVRRRDRLWIARRIDIANAFAEAVV